MTFAEVLTLLLEGALDGEPDRIILDMELPVPTQGAPTLDSPLHLCCPSPNPHISSVRAPVRSPCVGRSTPTTPCCTLPTRPRVPPCASLRSNSRPTDMKPLPRPMPLPRCQGPCRCCYG